MFNSVITAPMTVSMFLICLFGALVLGVLNALVFSFRSQHSGSLPFALVLAAGLLSSCKQPAEPTKGNEPGTTEQAATQQTEPAAESTKEQGAEESSSVPASDTVDYAGELKLDLDSETKKQETRYG